MIATLLQRWAQALGGLDRLRQVETVYVRSKVEVGGLAGTAEEWCTARGQYRQWFDLAGIYKNLIVLDRDRGWILDQNGKVRELAGAELEDEIATAYVASFAHLVAGRMPGQAEHVGEDEANNIVRFRPAGGRPLTYYLDKQTGLPAREERPDAERIRATYLGDWRKVEGVQVPFAQRQTTGDPRSDVVTTVEEVRFNVAVEEASFQRPAEVAPDYRFAHGHRARGIPIELTSNHIYLQLQVNDSAPLWFLLDTGAGGSAIDAEQARAHGLTLQGKLEGRGAGEGSTDVAFVAGATFRLPGVELLGQTIAAISLQPLTPFEGRPIQGILGYDFISRFVVELDYGAGMLHLHDPQGYSYAGSGESLPIVLDGNVPFAQAQLIYPGREPVSGQFLIDTGARMGLVLNKPFVERHQLIPERAISAPLGVGVGGETRQYVGRVSEMRLGQIAIQNVVAGFSQDAKGSGADPDRAGLIGGEILRRFTAIFDYAAGRMILEPNARLAEPYDYDMSGLFLAAAGAAFDSFKAHRVIADSPAAAAGLREGDVLLSLDGRPAREFTLEQVRQMFKEEGRTVQLQIRRAEEVLPVELVLRRLI